MDYSKPDLIAWETRNLHRRPEEIESRRLAEFDQLLDNWQKGKPVFDVLRDISYIMDLGAQNKIAFPPFENLGQSADNDLEKLAKARAEFTAFIKPDYLASPIQQASKAQIQHFADSIADNTKLTSYDIARGLVGEICSPAEGKPQPRSLKEFYSWLDKEESKAKQSNIKGSLNEEPESAVLARLKPYIQKMRKSSSAEKLIAAMHITPNGAGMIKPYNFNPNHLPENWEKLPIPFNAYTSGEDEYREGTVTARISTYSIALEPKDPAQLPQLKEEVQKAVATLGTIPPAFGIPVDQYAAPYERPFTPENSRQEEVLSDYRQSALPETAQHTQVEIRNGKVAVTAPLDLDDTYNLYYLLEHVMTPSPRTAQAMDAARYAEARSTPMHREFDGFHYSTKYALPEERMGEIAATADPVMARLKTINELHAVRITDDETWTKQMVSLAHDTMQGRIADQRGLYPSTEIALASGASTERYAEALRNRTLELMQDLTGQSNKESIALELARRQSTSGDAIRDQWRHEEEKAERGAGFSGGSLLQKQYEELQQKIAQREADLAFSDKVAAAAASRIAAHGNQVSATLGTTSLALKKPEVEPAIDRCYDGTLYTSRHEHSLLPRRELPTKLRKLMQKNETEAASNVLLEFSSSKKDARSR